MKKSVLNISNEQLIKSYLELNSSYKVAKIYNISATAVKRILKDLGVLRTQNQAAKERSVPNGKGTKRSESAKQKYSDLAKKRIGEKNSFYSKTHTEETKRKISESSKLRTKERNPNYKHGKYIRRPRDYKIRDFQKVRNVTFNRDKFVCQICLNNSSHLHAHHRIPFWVKPEAFLDVDNLVTVCSSCHFTKAHMSNWHSFSTDLVTDLLITKYSLSRERLNELATFELKK